MGAEARYVLRSGRWSSQGVFKSGGAESSQGVSQSVGPLRTSPGLVDLPGHLSVWWSSQGVSQSGEALRASPSLVELSGRLPVW